MVRTGVLLLTLSASASALAQPLDPYGPAPNAPPSPSPTPTPAPAGPVDPYASPGQDPVLAEQIAQQLVTRAQELLDAKLFVDAKQLAVEALVESPKGGAAEHAKFIIKTVNQALGIKDEEKPPVVVKPPPEVDTRPLEEPKKPVETPPAQPEGHSPKLAATVHAGFYGGLVGATIGSFFSSDSPASGAVPVGIVGGLAAGWYVPRLFDRWKWDEAQVRTVGSGSLWGAVAGGLFADVVMGANGGTVTAPGILVGASVGSTIVALGASTMAKEHKLTRGDVALVDTFAGIGTAGGLTVGLLMQPAQGEAYSLNAVLGAAGGVVAGLIVAPQTNTTPRRMLRIAGMSALGGAVPFLLYAAIQSPDSHGDERLTGALSSLGLLGGAWLGFYLTRDIDVGLDVPDSAGEKKGKGDDDDPPLPAVIERKASGDWRMGGLAIAPLGNQLATQQKGMALTVLGGRF